MTEELMTTSTVTIDHLIAGDHPPVMIPVTIVEESTDADVGTVARGTVLGRITASGKYRLYDAGNTDGSEAARVILVHDITASANAEEKVLAYAHGEFNEAELTGIDAAGKLDLQAAGIFVKEVK